MWLKEIFQGFCMAMADSVPGVSGGSVAFLMGFYEKFITSLNNLVGRKKEKRKDSIRYLGKLGVGWIIGMGLAVTVLTSLFDRYIYEVSSLFLGFVAVATLMMIRDHDMIRKRTFLNVICFAIGAALVVAVTFFNQSQNMAIDLADLNLRNGIHLFIAAMIAISAMVLPGISGSTLLLVFGLYIPIITAVRNFLHFELSFLPALVIFGMGVLTGIVLFVHWIKLALEKFPAQTMYTIIGLMAGSFYAIVKGPATLKIPKEAMNFSTFHPVFFIVGAALVIGLERYRRWQETVEEKKCLDTEKGTERGGSNDNPEKVGVI